MMAFIRKLFGRRCNKVVPDLAVEVASLKRQLHQRDAQLLEFQQLYAAELARSEQLRNHVARGNRFVLKETKQLESQIRRLQLEKERLSGRMEEPGNMDLTERGRILRLRAICGKMERTLTAHRELPLSYVPPRRMDRGTQVGPSLVMQDQEDSDA